MIHYFEKVLSMRENDKNYLVGTVSTSKRTHVNCWVLIIIITIYFGVDLDWIHIKNLDYMVYYLLVLERRAI